MFLLTIYIYTLLAPFLCLNKYKRDFLFVYFLQLVIRLTFFLIRLVVCFCFFFVLFFLNGGKEAKGFHLVSFRTVKFHVFLFSFITLHTTMKKDVETFRILRRRMGEQFAAR